MIFIRTRLCNLLEEAIRLHLQPDFDMTTTVSSCLLLPHVLARFATTPSTCRCWLPLHNCLLLSLPTSPLLARLVDPSPLHTFAPDSCSKWFRAHPVAPSWTSPAFRPTSTVSELLQCKLSLSLTHCLTLSRSLSFKVCW